MMMMMLSTKTKTLTAIAALFPLLGATASIGCSGQVASSDTQASQSQAQSTTTASASDSNKRPPPRHHGPPAEAFDACTGKAAGDVCSVKIHDETLAGKCINPPAGVSDTRIVCRPDKMPEHRGPGGRPGPHPPPPEVFAACDGKAADAACSVTFGDHTIDGTCKAPPPGVNETRLGCAPSRPH